MKAYVSPSAPASLDSAANSAGEETNIANGKTQSTTVATVLPQGKILSGMSPSLRLVCCFLLPPGRLVF
ncbi:unnamed protein product [Dibothriocephalus latus]|uniref:Uncharacterized protein n=1 Tax=Dibothriocephalus latus TaxID=60516 RepID=A0A3P7MCG5_DIBLA|nr:unnamed protein product [Dibothriocephalus latus]